MCHKVSVSAIKREKIETSLVSKSAQLLYQEDNGLLQENIQVTEELYTVVNKYNQYCWQRKVEHS